MDSKQQAECLQALETLRGNPASWPFLLPVDWKALGLDDYPLIVTRPMDLKTIGRKLRNRRYSSINQFWDDVDLIWSNCRTFNTEAAEVYQLATIMQRLTNKLRESVASTLHRSNSVLDNQKQATTRVQANLGLEDNNTAMRSPLTNEHSVKPAIVSQANQASCLTSPQTPGLNQKDKRESLLSSLMYKLSTLSQESLAKCLAFVAGTEAGSAVLGECIVDKTHPPSSSNKIVSNTESDNNSALAIATLTFDLDVLFDSFPSSFQSLSELVEATIKDAVVNKTLPQRKGHSKPMI